MDFTGFPPANKGFDGNISDLLDRVSRVERRRPPRDTGRGTTRTAFLDPDYRGWGPAALVIDGVLSTEFYNWTVPYVPNGSRMVRIMWTGLTWEIVGQVSDETIMLPYNGQVDIYGERSVDTLWNLRPRATKLAMSGLVVLSGMLMSVGAPPGGTLIGTLPEGMRPEFDLIFPIEYGDFPRALYITSAGGMYLSSGPAANAYISLDGIAFHAAGVGDWITVGTEGSSFGPNFANFGGQYGTCRFYKDPWGFVWWQGMVQITSAVSVDNTNIVTVPAPYRVNLEQHFRTTGNDVFAGLGGQPINGLNWKGGSPGSVGHWISLTGAVFVTTDAENLNPWKHIKAYANSWVGYGPTFPTPGYLRREDGLATTKGLLRAGTINTRMTMLTQEEMWPQGGRIILATIASNAGGTADRARLDIGAARDIDDNAGGGPGVIIGRSGGNGWFSWDGLKWVP